MVGKCIKLWSLKVKREYRHYIAEAKKKINKKITELMNKAEGTKCIIHNIIIACRRTALMVWVKA